MHGIVQAESIVYCLRMVGTDKDAVDNYTLNKGYFPNFKSYFGDVYIREPNTNMVTF